ncbi:hypothetical protein H257_02797 [Aphanomyces astaci]|uniref:DDE Tnp4 domain-containing protein n=1 Tax=Aphanomyces astaci TaxID=112090 RepID=W4GZX4_APHAT|nr:hypothetical protein H257_02797 [Aphanomyces astaci]ETV84881.1 hypothetical protein H257_02797 [Aphanomyces astaci]|eukprot:XP_009824899.1 hypothetical protein H257_02797 [Aphanomyces astaci]
MYATRDRSTFIAAVSLDPDAFDELLVAFFMHYEFGHANGRGGRPPKCIQKHEAPSLLLHFYCAPCEGKTLCELFRMAPATLARTLTKAERALAVALKSVPDSFIWYPSKQQQRRWAVMVNRVEPLVRGVWSFLDGKNYHVKAPTAPDLQNAYYNGWLHCTFVTGTSLFGVDGTIVWGRHSFVGSWNDADTSSPLRAKLLDEKFTLRGHGVVSDSAFPVSGSMLGKIRTPLKDGDLDRASPECRAGLSRMSAALT